MNTVVRICCLIAVISLVASCAAQKPAPQIQGADLVITALKIVAAKTYPAEGAPFTFEFTIKNIGTEATAEVKTTSKAIAPRIIVYRGKEMFATSQVIPVVKAGEEITLQTEILNKDPKAQAAKLSLAKAGDYTVTATIDPSGLITEASKANNSKSLAFMVAPKPPQAKK